MGAVRLAAKVSPTLFLSVASVWPIVALMTVPFGTVTIVVGCDAFATGAGFAVAAGSAVAAGFAVATFLAVVVGSLVAVFEQPATIKRAAAAKASQKFRWTWELHI